MGIVVLHKKKNCAKLKPAEGIDVTLGYKDVNMKTLSFAWHVLGCQINVIL